MISAATPALERGVAARVGFKPKYDLVIVIVSWNVKELLEVCLRSVSAAASTNDLSVHTVVIDNASTDGSANLVRQRFPDVELIASSENLGFARANNLALRKYEDQARYLLLLNPDTVVPADVFSKTVAFMDSSPDAGVLGCRIIKPDGVLDWPCKRSFILPSVLFYKALGLDRLFPKSKRFGRYQMTFVDENEIHEVDSVVGAFMLVRQECIKEIGALDESFFMYGEDLEWCYRAKSFGWKVYYVPTATIVHYKGKSTSKRSNRMIYHWHHSTWHVYRKQIAPQYPAVVNGIVWAGFYAMCAASLFANLFRPTKRVPGRR